VTVHSSLLLPLAYRPFLDPLPAWDVWYLLALPLIAGVSVVYKSIRSRWMKNIAWESTRTFLWILVGLCGAAAVLLGLVRFTEWMGS
jgi:cytochrome c oxidase assembly factor CtaG